ncbi:MAG: DNA translocase FtsK 4TM domain-containing protein, partial [Planctomycetota bacterium]
MKRKDILQEALGTGLVLLSLFLLVSLFTFHSGDVSFLSAPVNATTWNACGSLGVAISFGLLYTVGTLASWSLALLVGGWGISLVLRRSWPDLPYKVTGVLLFLVALSIGEAVTMSDASANLPYGGILGLFMAKVVLLAYLGETGTYLAVFYVALISFLLATDFLFIETALEAVGRIRVGDTWVQRFQRNMVAKHRGWSERKLGYEIEDARRRREQRHRRDKLVELIDEQVEGQAAAAVAKAPIAGFHAGRELLEDPPEQGERARSGDEGTVALADEPSLEEELSFITEEDLSIVDEDLAEEGETEIPVVEEEAEEEIEAEEEEEEEEIDEEPPTPKKARKKSIAKRKPRAVEPDESGYALPSVDLLDPPGAPSDEEDRINQVRCRVLEDTLSHFKIRGRVVGVLRGPAITQFELSLAQGTKSRQLFSLQNDLAIALKVEKVRIVAPLPGRGTIGIEVPNSFRESVVMKELLTSEE